MLYLTETQVAKRLTVSRATVRRWVRAGNFPHPVRLAPGSIRRREAELIAWETERVEEAAARAETDLAHEANV